MPNIIFFPFLIFPFLFPLIPVVIPLGWILEQVGLGDWGTSTWESITGFLTGLFSWLPF